jgi:hypothetical protein
MMIVDGVIVEKRPSQVIDEYRTQGLDTDDGQGFR